MVRRALSRTPFALLWRRRDLLALLVGRDLRARFAGSLLGVGWVIVTPLVQLAVLTLIFSTVLRVRFAADGALAGSPFALVLAWGLFPWIAAQDGLARATSSLVDGAVLVRRMSVEPAILPVVPVLANLAQVVVTLAVVALLSALLGEPPATTVVLCLPVLLLQTVLVLGAGWISAFAHVYSRDSAAVVGALLQVWFYLSPIVYPVSAAPESLQLLLWLNPMAGITESLRAFALGGEPPWLALGWSAACALGVLAVALRVVERASAEVPDLV